MARDRLIRLSVQPKKHTIEPLIKAFFGEWPSTIQWKSDRFFIDIPGRPLNPMHSEDRYIEVWIGEEFVDVITRQADHLVNSIADGFATYIAGSMNGQLEK